jgi:hypothetical protein
MMIDVITRPAAGGEAPSRAHACKERELGALFAQLTVIQAWHLHRRLSNPRSGDALAAAFNRMIFDRRARLLAFLGDARRRAALAG